MLQGYVGVPLECMVYLPYLPIICTININHSWIGKSTSYHRSLWNPESPHSCSPLDSHTWTNHCCGGINAYFAAIHRGWRIKAQTWRWWNITRKLTYGCWSKNRVFYSQIIPFVHRVWNLFSPSILGYHYFWVDTHIIYIYIIFEDRCLEDDSFPLKEQWSLCYHIS